METFVVCRDLDKFVYLITFWPTPYLSFQFGTLHGNSFRGVCPNLRIWHTHASAPTIVPVSSPLFSVLLNVNNLHLRVSKFGNVEFFERTNVMGNALSDLQEVWDNQFPPKPLWAVDQIPDLTGKVNLSPSGLTN
jgi:hypothetical protein